MKSKVQSVAFGQVLKSNPYHDKTGAFTSKDKVERIVRGMGNDVPPEPGTTKIPEGYVRLYHQTTEENALSVGRSGLTMEHARGIEGPRALYATEKPFYGDAATHPTVEIAVPSERFEAPMFVLGDVSPKDIVVVHLPWHGHARYLDNPEDVKRVLGGELDGLLDGRFPNEAKAINWIKDKYGKVKKANPYHDEQGLFTSRINASHVSTTDVFEKMKNRVEVLQQRMQLHKPTLTPDGRFDHEVVMEHAGEWMEKNKDNPSHWTPEEYQMMKGDMMSFSEIWLPKVEQELGVRIEGKREGGKYKWKVTDYDMNEDMGRRRFVRDAAKMIGFKEAGIDLYVHSDADFFELDGEKREYGGYYQREEGGQSAVIGIYTNNMRYRDSYLKVLIHEFEHHKFQKATTWDGFTDKWINDIGELKKTDGVTGYSKNWWKAHANGQAQFHQAVNETLVEIAQLDEVGKLGVAPVWKKLSKELNKSYDKLKLKS